MIWITATDRCVVQLTCDRCPRWRWTWDDSIGRISESDMQDAISHHNYKYHGEGVDTTPSD